jgi:hypothetical protein
LGQVQTTDVRHKPIEGRIRSLKPVLGLDCEAALFFIGHAENSSINLQLGGSQIHGEDHVLFHRIVKLLP